MLRFDKATYSSLLFKFILSERLSITLWGFEVLWLKPLLPKDVIVPNCWLLNIYYLLHKSNLFYQFFLLFILISFIFFYFIILQLFSEKYLQLILVFVVVQQVLHILKLWFALFLVLQLLLFFGRFSQGRICKLD